MQGQDWLGRDAIRGIEYAMAIPLLHSERDPTCPNQTAVYWLSHTDPASTHLVGFCDASQNAYAAVIYMRVMGEIPSVAIVASKTRVAPLKPVTIPRLELLSALLLARLIDTIGKALEAEIHLETPLCFTDSKIALGWIRGANKEWKQFVENRVVEIRRLVSPDCWYHCSGITNPADIPSRGLSCVDVNKEMSSWLKGPIWLTERKLPDAEKHWTVPDPCLEELRKSDKKSIALCVPSRPTTIIEVERFSTLHRLQRVLAQVFRFIRLVQETHKNSELISELGSHNSRYGKELQMFNTNGTM